MECHKVFLTNLEKRKAIIKQQFEFKQTLLWSNLKLWEKRIQNCKSQRENEQIVRIAKNKAKSNKTKLRIIELNDLAFYRTLAMKNKRKNKDRNTVKNLKNLKSSALVTKQNKELNQYWAKCKSQIRTMEINKLLIEKCVENVQPKVEEEEVIDEIDSNENEVIEVEAESSENCTYIPVSDTRIYGNKYL